MKDLITYCEDTQALLDEVTEKLPHRVVADEETGAVVGFAITKTPTIRNGLKTLSVVRVDDEQLAELKSLLSVQILAEVEPYGDLLAAMSIPNRVLYDSVHDQTPYDVDDGEGNMITITPNELIGGFA